MRPIRALVSQLTHPPARYGNRDGGSMRGRNPAWAAKSAIVAMCLVGCSGATSIRSPEQAASPLRFPIVFSRFLPGADHGYLFRIDPGSTEEQRIRSVNDGAILAPDGGSFMDVALAPDGRLTTATYAIDGSNYHVLPIPDPTLQIGYGSWSPDGSRIASEAWDDANPGRIGIYSRRSSDGGGLIRLTDAGTRRDYPIPPPAFSSDGSRLLFFRPHAEGETGDSAPLDLFVVGADGGGLLRLSPPGTTSSFIWSGSTASWSPDGAEVAFVASKGSFWENRSRSVYVVEADGSGLRGIGPRGDIYDASWSPDGRWIALTMASGRTRWDPQHPLQLYLMHPDGSGLVQLTPKDDGLFSLGPKWSPDGTQLLFARGSDDEHVTDLWAVDVDGSDLYRVTREPAGYGSYAWVPAESA
jgi:Tol biopolymer transport system component